MLLSVVWGINGTLWIEVWNENICKPENKTTFWKYFVVYLLFYVSFGAAYRFWSKKCGSFYDDLLFVDERRNTGAFVWIF